jgi:mercuric ion transport protein
MTDSARAATVAGRTTASEMGLMLLVAGGLVSAFGAASCCALPLLLGALGLGSAWLGSLAVFAGPHRPELLAAAMICLLAGGGILFRRRHADAACAPGAACGRPGLRALVTGALSLGAVLTALGFVFA